MVKIQNKSYRALIDTGSHCSLIDKNVYDHLKYKTPIRKCNYPLTAANGTPLKVFGYTKLRIKIASEYIDYFFIVVQNLSRSFILGRDFLYKNKVNFYTELKQIKINGVYVPLANDTEICSVSRLSRDVTLKPFTSCVVNMRAQKFQSKYNTDALFSPPDKGFVFNKPNVHVMPAVVKYNRHMPVRIVNNSIRKLKLKKGCVLGTLKELRNSIDLVENKQANRPPYNSKLTESEFLKQANIPEKYNTEISTFLLKNRNIFAFHDKDLTVTDLMTAEIYTEDHKPINMKPYRTPIYHRQFVNESINDMLEAGLIIRSNSAWSFPIVVVNKKEESPGVPAKKRLCVDFRNLNNICILRSHPMPHVDDILGQLSGSTFFSSIDLRSGFHQIPLSKEASEKCTFSCFRGKFSYTVMPFGLKNAPNVFQDCMHLLLEGCEQFCKAYMDDVLIHTNGTLEDHLKHVQIIIDRMFDHNFKIKLSKCHWAKQEIEYLGFKINRSGVSPLQDKIKAIKSLKPPTTVKQIRSFLGMVSFYRRFIPNFAEMSSPLVDLTKKFSRFHWDNTCQKAFQDIKAQLCVVPLLGYPDLNKPYLLYTDSSDKSIGAVLVQESEGQPWLPNIPNEKPIYFLSKKLTDSQIKAYSTTEKELYAIYFSVMKLRFYLEGARFTIKTDHRPLEHIFTAEMTNKRCQRWAMAIRGFNCRIEYLKGETNVCADLLSRSPPDEPVEYDRSQTENSNEENKIVAQPLKSDVDEDSLLKLNYINDNKSVHSNSINAVINSNDIVPKDCYLANEKELFHPPPVPSPENFNIKEEQEKDEALQTLKNKIINKTAKKFVLRHHTIRNDILYYISYPDDDAQLRLYVPDHLKIKVIKQYHDELGHLGVNKVYQTIKKKYFWINLFKDLDEYIGKCIVCKSRNQISNNAPVQETETPNGPMIALQLDLQGPFTTSLSNNKYICSFICLYSGWLESFPIPDKTAQSIVQCLLEYMIPRHGCPLVIISDNGSEFVNEYFKTTLEKLHIKHILTSTYNPRANGAVERSHKTLNDVLSKLMGDHADTWDLHLNYALMALRSSVSSTTNKSPFQILYNRPCILPLDNLLMPRNKTNSEDYHELALENMHKAHLEVLKAIRKSKIKRNEKANKNRKTINFSVGDSVYIKNHNKHSKLDKNWLPYYTIVRQTGPLSYLVINQLTKKENRVHVNRMKLSKLKWKVPKPIKPIRKARMAAVPPSSSSSESSYDESDVELVTDNNTDSDSTVIYDPKTYFDQ